MKFKPFEELFEIPLRNGLTKPKRVRGEGFKMINMGELFAFSRMKNIPMDRVPLTEKEKDSSMVEPGDLLFARQSLVREGAGQCAIFLEDEEEVCFESHIIRCRLDKEISNPLFYYYFFKSKQGKQIINEIIEQGAGAAGIRGSDLAKLKVPYLKKEIQDDIAEKINYLDNKIELNYQINQTLKKIALAIFKSWFVDFEPVKANIETKQHGQAPERAALRAISGKTNEQLDQLNKDQLQQLATTAALFADELEGSELGEIPKGLVCGVYGDVLTPISERIGSQVAELYSATVKGLELRDAKFNKKLSKDYSKNKKIKRGELVFGLSRDVLNFGHMKEEIGSVSPVYEIFEVDAEKYKPELLEMYIRQTMNRHMDILKPGAREGQAINRKYFLSKSLLIPCMKLQDKYIEITKPLFDLIDHTLVEIKTLENIRDALFPKLLSGEITLNDPQSIVGAVAG